jgi:hypothetical protein
VQQCIQAVIVFGFKFVRQPRVPSVMMVNRSWQTNHLPPIASLVCAGYTRRTRIALASRKHSKSQASVLFVGRWCAPCEMLLLVALNVACTAGTVIQMCLSPLIEHCLEERKYAAALDASLQV